MKCLCSNVDLHYEIDIPDNQITSHRDQNIPWWDVVECAFTDSPKTWATEWPNFVRAKKCNLVAVAADFYLTEHIIHASSVNKIDTKLAAEFISAGFSFNEQIVAGQQAIKHQLEIESSWGPVIKDYLHFAMVCEMTHDWSFTRTFSHNPYPAFWGWSQLVKKVGRSKAVEHAIEIFTRPWKNTAFGGRRWAEISKVLLAVEKGEYLGARFDYHLFLDRVFSLQHNTGHVFSKFDDWNQYEYNKDPYSSLHRLDYLDDVLEAHHIGDIYTLKRHASPTVNKILNMLGEPNEYPSIHCFD